MVRAHGRVPGGAAAVIAMGKLGGREMTAASDLDLILIYDFDAEAALSSGVKPLAPTPVLHAPDAAPDQRLHRADRRGHPLRRRHAPAALGPEGAGRHAAVELHPLPGERGLDLGAHGADPRARRLGAAGPARGGRDGHPRCAPASRATGPRPPPTCATCARASRRRRARAIPGSSSRCAAAWSIWSSSPSICNSCMRRPTRDVLSQNTVEALENLAASRRAARPAPPSALLPAARLLNNLTQVLRLCLDGPFDAGQGPGRPQGAAGAGRRRPRFQASGGRIGRPGSRGGRHFSTELIV